MRNAGGYDVFISYSHAEDSALAAALQAGLERFSRPWYRPRVLRVFRDTTDLSAAPGLWAEITRALEISDWFVLIASPRAAESRWVRREVAWWLANKDHGKFLIALSSGTISWSTGNFDWQETDALPSELSGAFTEEPLWADLRGVREALPTVTANTTESAQRRLLHRRAKEQVGDWIADLAAPIHHKPKDALIGEHLRQQRRIRHTLQAGVSVLSVLTLVASVAAVIAVNQRDQAIHETNVIRSQFLAAKADDELAAGQGTRIPSLLSLVAYAVQPTPQALSAMLSVAGTREVGPPMQDDNKIYGLAYAPSKPIVAAASESGLELWSTSFRGQPFDDSKSSIGTYLLTWRGNTAVAGTSVSFSPDGRLIAVAAADGTVQVFDVNQLLSPEGQTAIILRAASAPATSVAWNAQGSTLAAGDGNGDIHLWSLGTILALGAEARRTGAQYVLGGPGAVAQGHVGPVTTLAFEGRTDKLAVGGKDGTSLLGTHARRLIGFFGAHDTSITAVGFTPGGQTLASGGADGKIRLWDVRTGRNVGTLPAGPVTSLAFVTGSSLISGGTDARIRTWDTAAGYETANVASSSAITALAVAPDRRTVAVATSDLQIDFWTSGDRRQLGSPRELPAPLTLATFSADGSTLAVLDQTGRVEAWREDGRKLAGLITSPAGSIDALAVSWDGGMLAAGEEDGAIQLWKLPGGALVKTIPAASTAITAVAFSPDGKLLAGGINNLSPGGDIPVQLWSLPSGVREGPPLSGMLAPVTSLAFSPDGNTLAVAGDKVALWHLPSRREFERPLPITIEGSIGSGGVTGTVVFSPTNSDLLAVAGAGFRLWDTRDEHSLSPVLTGAGPLAFTADGAEIASATANGVQLWDVLSATQLGLAFPTGEAPNAVGFDRGGRLLTTVALGVVTLWGFDASFLRPLLCASGQPPLSQSEWDALAIGGTVKNTCQA